MTMADVDGIAYPSTMPTAYSPVTDLDEEIPADITAADQQPDWSDPVQAAAVRAELTKLPGLVSWEEAGQLRSLLAKAAVGSYHVIQAGDCAEDPAECEPPAIMRKADLIDSLADMMAAGTGKPVLRIGRIAGQFAKPRSESTETVDGVELPVYRGHLVNSPEPTVQGRRADPTRMLSCYHASYSAVTHLRRRISAWASPACARVWTSHEALVLDYELPLLRRNSSGDVLLASTHLPWIGERTRRPDGPHAMMLAKVANPVACKVGPTVRARELLALCARLDPERECGRLTLIARMGAQLADRLLPPLVRAVSRAGHQVVWLCDPMHGNTVKSPAGVKVRSVKTIVAEVHAFQRAVTRAGGVPGGLHLEMTPFDVRECVWAEPAELESREKNPQPPTATSYCDPRLNPAQAVEVVREWACPTPR
jgi:3-deoxy-7-phosphoheptulonate synthase